MLVIASYTDWPRLLWKFQGCISVIVVIKCISRNFDIGDLSTWQFCDLSIVCQLEKIEMRLFWTKPIRNTPTSGVSKADDTDWLMWNMTFYDQVMTLTLGQILRWLLGAKGHLTVIWLGKIIAHSTCLDKRNTMLSQWMSCLYWVKRNSWKKFFVKTGIFRVVFSLEAKLLILGQIWGLIAVKKRWKSYWMCFFVALWLFWFPSYAPGCQKKKMLK